MISLNYLMNVGRQSINGKLIDSRKYKDDTGRKNEKYNEMLPSI